MINLKPKNLPAGFLVRTSAFFIDIIFINIFAAIFFFSITLFLSQSSLEFVSSLTGALFVVFLYEPISYSRWGKTLGKKIVGIKVVEKNMGKISYWQGVGRVLARGISGIPLFLGYFWTIWDKNKCCFHDKIAGTYVVVENKKRARIGMYVGIILIVIPTLWITYATLYLVVDMLQRRLGLFQ